MSYDLTDDLVKDAFRDFFQTTPGKIALSALQGVVLSVPSQNVSPCALRDQTGMRRMAQILVSMARKEDLRDDTGSQPKQPDSTQSGRFSRRRGPARDIPGGRRP